MKDETRYISADSIFNVREQDCASDKKRNRYNTVWTVQKTTRFADIIDGSRCLGLVAQRNWMNNRVAFLLVCS